MEDKLLQINIEINRHIFYLFKGTESALIICRHVSLQQLFDLKWTNTLDFQNVNIDSYESSETD